MGPWAGEVSQVLDGVRARAPALMRSAYDHSGIESALSLSLSRSLSRSRSLLSPLSLLSPTLCLIPSHQPRTKTEERKGPSKEATALLCLAVLNKLIGLACREWLCCVVGEVGCT